MPDHDNDQLKAQLDAEELLQGLPAAPTSLPTPWKSNGDARRDLLIKKVDTGLEQLQKIEKNPAILDLNITFGQAAIKAYDEAKIKFAHQKLARDDMLHSLPKNSATYQIQKQYCNAMDKVEKDFLHNLTDPDYFRKILHNDLNSLDRKIAIEQKAACLRVYNEHHETISAQSPTIKNQFIEQYKQTFPNAKTQIKSQSNVENKAIKHEANSNSLRSSHQKTIEQNQKIRDIVSENVSKVEQTTEQVTELKQTISNPVSASKSTPSKQNKNQELSPKNESPRPLLVKAGRVAGYEVGVVTESVAGAIFSIAKTAALGAWELAKTAAETLSQLTKSEQTLARENQATANTSQPESILPISSSKENNEPSLYVKATTIVGGLIGWGLNTVLDGGIGLGSFAIQSAQKLYQSLATSTNYTMAKEGDLKIGHSKAIKNDSMTTAAVNSTISTTPSSSANLQHQTTPTIKK